MNHLDEIRYRVAIEDLVGGYVQLKKSGRNLKGLCPFHSEKTPSFMVSPEKGIAYCFGCHQGGDIFKFLQLVENITFAEATRILADRAGVNMPRQNPGVFNKKVQVIEINQKANEFYRSELSKNTEANQYFLNRGLTASTIDQFKLGYAPDSFNALKNFLIKEGYDSKLLVEAAVLNQRSIADQNTYDRFRDRLIFPIFDHQGNTVAFSGRLFKELQSSQDAPKYINSPETPSYDKSFVLYGLNFAKESIKQQDLAIFVEGYMDVISTHQAGTKNTIATCGTAVTPQQLKLVSRYTKNIALAFDQDSAGIQATLRAIELAQLAKMNISIISIPNGKDPDECAQADPELWVSSVENRQSVIDFYFNYIQKQFSLQSIEGKREALSFILPIIKSYPTDFEKGVYLNRLALILQTDVKFLWNDLLRSRSNSNKPRYQEGVSMVPSKKIWSEVDFLMGLVLFNSDFFPSLLEKIHAEIDLGVKWERFYNACKTVYTRESQIRLDLLMPELSDEEFSELKIISLAAEDRYVDFSTEKLEVEYNALIRRINRDYWEARQKLIKMKLNEVKEKSEIQVLMTEFQKISIQLNKIKTYG